MRFASHTTKTFYLFYESDCRYKTDVRFPENLQRFALCCTLCCTDAALRCTNTGAPLLETSGKTSGKRAGPARIMHTMAKINPQEHSLGCIALSAEVCGLRHYRLTFWPPITSLAHFHPLRKPPQAPRQQA